MKLEANTPKTKDTTLHTVDCIHTQTIPIACLHNMKITSPKKSSFAQRFTIVYTDLPKSLDFQSLTMTGTAKSVESGVSLICLTAGQTRL